MHYDDPELTDHDRLIAALVDIGQRLPGGHLVAAETRLGKAIEAIDQLFTLHKLPTREQLIAELTLWHCHLKDGIRLMSRSYHLLDIAVQTAKYHPDAAAPLAVNIEKGM